MGSEVGTKYYPCSFLSVRLIPMTVIASAFCEAISGIMAEIASAQTMS